MPRVNFVFAIHFHQPVGQLKWINDRVYENSYKLLLEVFKEFADLRFTVHVSGPLLLYLKDHYPDYIDQLAKLHGYGAIELLLGSFGEAILPIIPHEDRVMQISYYSALFEKLFGFKPKGFWLPERVWEPGLPQVLAKTGVDYVLVDDSVLHRAGYGEPVSYYAYYTEEDGYRVKVFFIDSGLRYILPWRSSDEVINYMVSKASGDNARVLVWGSDAEKFGEWWDPVSSRNWLRDFLSKLRGHPVVNMVHPSSYLKDFGVRGLIYLPTGSYDKMMEWSGGFFRNFLVKYRESNNMHKKMLWVRSKLLRMPFRDEEAWRHYLLAQCNDPYWHGLFGGIYLTHLRQAIYENLLVAERIAEERINYYVKQLIVNRVDFDYDGYEEILLESPTVNLYVKPSDGGTVFEFDVKKKGYEHNVQNTMTRVREPYLRDVGFNEDWYRRVSARLHMWMLDTNIWDWVNNTPFRDRSDAALKEHKAVVTKDSLKLVTVAGFYTDSLATKVLVEKSVKLMHNGYEVEYRLENIGENALEALLGFEYHVAPKLDLVNKDSKLSYEAAVEHPIHEAVVEEAKRVRVKHSNYPGIVLEPNRTVTAWVAPIYSLARTEKGLQNMFQCLGVMFTERVSLKPKEVYEISIAKYVEL